MDATCPRLPRAWAEARSKGCYTSRSAWRRCVDNDILVRWIHRHCGPTPSTWKHFRRLLSQIQRMLWQSVRGFDCGGRFWCLQLVRDVALGELYSY